MQQDELPKGRNPGLMVANALLYAKRLLNGLLFYIGWFYIVISAAEGMPVRAVSFAVAILAFHFLFIDHQLKEVVLVASLIAFGFILDTTFVLTGLVRYESPDPWISWGAPLWILGIHGIFASTVYHSLSWLKDYRLTSAVLGGLGAFFTYVAGEKLGGVEFLLPGLTSPLIIAAVWVFYCPFVYIYATWLQERITH